MVAQVTVKTNAKVLQKKFNILKKRFPKIINRELMASGFLLVQIIKELTKKGKSFKRTKFPKYSDSYAKFKEKYVGTNVVNLQLSSDMLNSLTPDHRSVKKTGRNKVTVSFSNSEMRERAFRIQTGDGQPKREFFGFDKTTENKIQKEFEKQIKRELKRLRL